MAHTDLYRVMKSLRDHERGIKPDPAWVRASRETLLMQVRNTIPSAGAVAKNRLLAQTGSRILRIVRGPVLSFIAIFAALLGGSLVSVSAAERSLPGDSLYALKLVTEQARLALTMEQSARMRLKVEFTKRRVEELRTIVSTPVSKKEERASKAAEILKQDLNTLKQQLNTAAMDGGNDKDMTDAAKLVEQETVQVVKTLTETKKDLAPDTKLTVSDAQASAADIGMKALQMLVDAKNYTGENVIDEGLDASVAAHADVVKDVAAQSAELAAQSSGAAVNSGDASATSTAALARDVETMLGEAQQLLLENKTQEAIKKIWEASVQSFLAQKQAEGFQVLLLSGATSSVMNADGTSSTSVGGTGSTTGTSTSSTGSTSDQTAPLSVP